MIITNFIYCSFLRSNLICLIMFIIFWIELEWKSLELVFFWEAWSKRSRVFLRRIKFIFLKWIRLIQNKFLNYYFFIFNLICLVWKDRISIALFFFIQDFIFLLKLIWEIIFIVDFISFFLCHSFSLSILPDIIHQFELLLL